MSDELTRLNGLYDPARNRPLAYCPSCKSRSAVEASTWSHVRPFEWDCDFDCPCGYSFTGHATLTQSRFANLPE